MFLERENKKLVVTQLQKQQMNRPFSSKRINSKTTLTEQQYLNFRIKKIINSPSNIQLDQKYIQAQTNLNQSVKQQFIQPSENSDLKLIKELRTQNLTNASQNYSNIVDKKLYDKIFEQQIILKDKLKIMNIVNQNEEQIQIENCQTLQNQSFYKNYEVLLNELDILKNQKQCFKLNKLKIEQDIIQKTTDKTESSKKIGFYIKDIIQLMDDKFNNILKQNQNLLTKSNLREIDKQLCALNHRLNDLMMVKSVNNQQYLILIDAFFLFFTVLLEKVIQSCQHRGDQNNLENIIETQKIELEKLQEENFFIKEEQLSLQKQLEENKKNNNQTVNNLQDEVKFLKNELQLCMQKLNLQEGQDDDPNDIFMTLEMSFAKSNNHFNKIEQAIDSEHLENLSSLNLFAKSIKEKVNNSTLSKNSVNQLQNAQQMSRNNINTQYGLCNQAIYFTTNQHPFAYHIIKKNTYIKIKKLYKTSDQQTNELLDAYFQSVCDQNNIEKDTFQQLFINYLFQSQNNILNISIKINDVCDYIQSKGDVNKNKKVFYQKLFGLNNIQPLNKAQVQLFIKIISYIKYETIIQNNAQYLNKDQIIKNLKTKLKTQYSNQFIEQLEQLFQQDSEQKLTDYQQSIKETSSNNKLLIRLNQAFNTNNFYEIKNKLLQIFGKIDCNGDNKIIIKDFEDITVENIKIFNTDCLSEIIYSNAIENNQIDYEHFLSLFQKQSLVTEDDQDYIEEHLFYQLIIETIQFFYLQQIEIIKNQISIQVEDNSFFDFSKQIESTQYFNSDDNQQFQQKIFLKLLNKNMLTNYVDNINNQNQDQPQTNSKKELNYILKIHNKNELFENLNKQIESDLINYKYINNLLIDSDKKKNKSKAGKTKKSSSAAKKQLSNQKQKKT